MNKNRWNDLYDVEHPPLASFEDGELKKVYDSSTFGVASNYSKLKRILLHRPSEELNVVKELATGKLKLVPFEFKKAAKLTAAAQAAIRLVELSGQVSDKFPDDLSPEKVASFRALLQELKENFGI